MAALMRAMIKNESRRERVECAIRVSRIGHEDVPLRVN